VLAVGALLLWLPVAGVRGVRSVADDAGSWSLLREPLARQVTAFLGLQSVQFYSIAAWLPTLLADAGVPVGEGGLLLAVSSLVGAAAALLAPAAAGRMRTQRPLVAAVLLAFGIGLGGLLAAPASGTLVWVSVFGLAQGGGFALGLTLIVLRSGTPLVAARLGGVAQCVGYLVAATGPVLLGAVHDATGGWHWPIVGLLVVLVPMAWAGWGASRDAVLRDGPRAPAAEVGATGRGPGMG
jgi:CP family cyanate transporter-like MFS transporter